MTSIVPISNQKGGVGKTTTAVTLAVCFSEMGKKVLLIDANPQAHASNMFKDKKGVPLKIRAKLESKSIAEGLLSKHLTLSELIYKTKSPNLDIICANKKLKKNFAQEKIAATGSQKMLRRLFKRSNLELYDIIIIDTPPDTDLVFQNIMYASNYYLIPMTAEADPFDGIDDLIDEVHEIREENPQLVCLGIIVTNYYPEKITTHRKIRPLIEKYAKKFGMKYLGEISFTSTVSSSSLLQTPLPWRDDIHGKAKKTLNEYYQLAKNLLPELKGTKRGNVKIPKIDYMPQELVNPSIIDSAND